VGTPSEGPATGDGVGLPAAGLPVATAEETGSPAGLEAAAVTGVTGVTGVTLVVGAIGVACVTGVAFVTGENFVTGVGGSGV